MRFSIFKLINGMMQGSVMFPLLFNMYTNPLVDSLKETYTSYRNNGRIYNYLYYINGVTLSSPLLKCHKKYKMIKNYNK